MGPARTGLAIALHRQRGDDRVLTQLVLGADRDSDLVAPGFDERNPAVLAVIGRIIDGARRAGRKVGIAVVRGWEAVATAEARGAASSAGERRSR